VRSARWEAVGIRGWGLLKGRVCCHDEEGRKAGQWWRVEGGARPVAENAGSGRRRWAHVGIGMRRWSGGRGWRRRREEVFEQRVVSLKLDKSGRAGAESLEVGVVVVEGVGGMMGTTTRVGRICGVGVERRKGGSGGECSVSSIGSVHHVNVVAVILAQVQGLGGSRVGIEIAAQLCVRGGRGFPIESSEDG
jgi:hypothetical protein